MKFLTHLTPFYCLLSFLGAHHAEAQLKQPYRFETEIKNVDDGFTIVSLKKDGLALIRDMEKYTQGRKKWEIDILDTLLVKSWSTELELDNRLVLVGYEQNQTNLYLLYREGESDYYGFQLKTVNYREQKVETDKIKFDMNFRITHFTMAGNNAIFGGYISNEPAVLLFNQDSDQTKILPGLFMTDVKLLDIRTNQNQSFNVLLQEKKGRDSRRLIVRTYDHEGNLLIDDIINIDSRFTILSGITSTLEREEMVIMGTYGEGSNPQALGLFSVLVDPFNEQDVAYTDFSSLEHFLDYLPDRKSARIKTKAREEKTVGNLADYKAYVMPFRIDERPDGFYLLCEMYYPTHNYNPYPANSFYNPYSYGYNPYGMSPYSSRYYNTPYGPFNNPSVSGDFKMIQSLVVKLGPMGKVEKDVSLKFDDVRQAGLEQISDFIVHHDSIVVLYKWENDIFYLREVGVPEEKGTIIKKEVSLNNPDATLKYENRHDGYARHWYDHQFFVWGYQNVSGRGERHQVFFVNRVSLE